MKVAIGGLSHESSTFTPVQTTRQSYQERFLLDGDAILKNLPPHEYADRRLYRRRTGARLRTDSDPFRLASAQRADSASAL